MPEAPDEATLAKLASVPPGAHIEILYVGYVGSGERGIAIGSPTKASGEWVAFDARIPEDPWLVFADPHGGMHGVAWSQLAGLQIDLPA